MTDPGIVTYASGDQLAAWLGTTAPSNAGQLCRSATILVAAACYRDPYTDSPSDVEAPVLRDATCAQAATWIALGVDPSAAGVDSSPVKSSKIGTGSVERDTTTLAAARLAAVTELAPEPRAILLAAGLLYEPVPVGAPDGDCLRHFGLSGPWPRRYGMSLEEMEAVDLL